jgi:PAS domain S-box-containing protein
MIFLRNFFVTYVIPYSIGLSALAFSLLLSYHLEPLIDKSSLFLVLGAIVFSAWYGGLEVGLTCLALGVLGTKFFLLSPIWSFRTAATEDLLHLGFFLLIGFEAVWLMAHRYLADGNEEKNVPRQRPIEQPPAEAGDADLLEGLPDACLVLDHTWCCVTLNEEAARLWGKTKHEIAGRPLQEVLPADAWNVFSSACQRAKDEHMPRRFEYYRLDSDQWLACHAYPQQDRLVVSMQDISDAKRAEETGPRTQGELESRVMDRMAELDAANRRLTAQTQELAQSNAELERFAFISFHDLQEPLRMAIIYLEFLKQHGEERRESASVEYINSALASTQATQALIQDLASYSELGSREKKREPVDCVKLLELTIRKMKEAIETTGAVIRYDTLPTVIGDGAQLGQVFQNIIDNSLKFRGDAPPYIHVSAERKEQDWLFSVNDNGVGMEAQSLEQIFMIFRRLPAAQQYPGTGMGLAMCKKIIQRHAGQIWAESKPGQGATVYFTIPGDAVDHLGLPLGEVLVTPPSSAGMPLEQ